MHIAALSIEPDHGIPIVYRAAHLAKESERAR
jgi:hypothetical protein